MNHYASPKFWECYSELSLKIKNVANRNFELLKDNPRHSSLHLKKVGRYWSVRVGIFYRAVGVDTPSKDGIIWFWIGSHSEYDRLISKK